MVGYTRLDMSIVRGDSRTIEVTVVDRAGDPIDLTGATVSARIGSPTDPDAAVATVTVTDAAAGEVSAVYSAASTAALTADQQYIHQIRLVDSPITRTLVTGLVTVARSLFEA